MKSRIFAAAAASGLLLAGLSAGSASATIALSGGVNLQASSQVGPGPGAVDASHGDSWSGARRGLRTGASAIQSDGIDSVSTGGEIQASWRSTDLGFVTIENYGLSIVAEDPAIHIVASSLSAGLDGPFDWSYQFIATRDGRFDLHMDMIGAGTDLEGLGAWALSFADGADATQMDFLTGYFGAPTDEITNDFSHRLVAGHTYTVGLRNLDGFLASGDTTGASRSAQEGGTVDWAITSDPAPEPSTWGLALAGFGLAGAALRRRRAGCAVA